MSYLDDLFSLVGKVAVTIGSGGVLGGAMAEINMDTFFRRGIKLIGSTLRSRSSEMKAEILADLERNLWQSFSSGEIKPVIYKTLPITQAEEAHAILQRRENIGKVVLTFKKGAQGHSQTQ